MNYYLAFVCGTVFLFGFTLIWAAVVRNLIISAAKEVIAFSFISKMHMLEELEKKYGKHLAGLQGASGMFH